MRVIADELARRGHRVVWVSPWIVDATVDGRRTWLWSTRSELNTQIAARVVARKDWTDRILTEAGVSVPEGRKFVARQLPAALQYLRELNQPAVVKPALSPRGQEDGVTRNVTTCTGLRAAFTRSLKVDPRVLVQRQIPGPELRILVVEGRYVAAARKVPDPTTGLLRPPVFHGITREVHETYRRAAETAAQAIPGLGLAGIDMIVERGHTQPGPYAIIEINGAPGIAGHENVSLGEPTYTGPIIVDALEHRLAQRPAGVGSGQQMGGTWGNTRTTRRATRGRD